MSQQIRFKRGNKNALPILNIGEPALCLDTKEVFIGSSEGNLQIVTANGQHVPNFNADMVDNYHASDFALNDHNHNHDDLNNIPANKHIDHSAVSIIAGSGLSGGGSIETDRTLSLTGQALAFHNLTSNGIVVKTNTNEANTRSIVSGSTKIVVTNGNGINGNPIIDISEPNINLNDFNGILSINKGGTNATDAVTAINNLLPSQINQSTKFLQTNGTNVSWNDIQVSNFFHAVKNNINQTGIPVNVWVKVTFPTAIYNANNRYNTSTSTYIPQDLGIYFICCNVTVTGGLTDRISLQTALYKNGVLVNRSVAVTSYNSADDTPTIVLCCPAYVTSTTDYFEIYFYSGGGNIKTIGGADSITNFYGFKII